MTEKHPDEPSSDFKAMQPYWLKVKAMLGGVDALRAAGEMYLPKFPGERQPNYDYRLKNSRFTNIFGDVCENLASKPFAKKAALSDKASQQLKDFSEDVDGLNNNLHVFASGVFFAGVSDALTWVLVDHTKVPTGATVAEEKEYGARPYWVHIPVERL
jgi:hypothetical protein